MNDGISFASTIYIYHHSHGTCYCQTTCKCRYQSHALLCVSRVRAFTSPPGPLGRRMLLESGCAVRVGFVWCLGALVCGLECPEAWLLSAVNASMQPHRLLAAGAAWNIHFNQLHQYKGASCCVLDFWSYWINLWHSVWFTDA